jgi:crotonobetainyl-CoA:carnitine CoA-transferase CaiB-like acyl-CoA transferase
MLERAAGTHKFSVSEKAVPTHFHVLCSLPVFSTPILTKTCLGRHGFIPYCALSEAKGMVIIMGKNILDQRLQKSCTEKITDGDGFDIYKEFEDVANEIGLSAKDAGGNVIFYGADPIVKSTVRLGAGASIGLMLKALAATNIWRMRGGKGQDLHLDLAKSIHRLSILYKKYEKLNGFPPDSTDKNVSALIGFFKTKDGRHVIPENVMPKMRDKMQELLGCGNDIRTVATAISQWNSDELETIANKQGIVMGKIRTLEEFMKENVYTEYLKDTPLIEIEKIGDSAPELFSIGGITPLAGVRALGMGHVIAGAGLGRALACHGADVLNIWKPNEFELEGTYCSASVGMRSSRLNYKEPSGNKRLKELLKSADIFFANRRPALMEEIGMTAEECTVVRPGIIYCNISHAGNRGPWISRPGYDQVAGAVTGMMTFEGDLSNPSLPVINVVNDYLISWLAAAGVMAALAKRASEGGSYRVHVSLVRTSLWLLSLGIFDKQYVENIAGSPNGHEKMIPELFTANTPLGIYQGYTDQVHMSQMQECYRSVLVPRGSSQPFWLAQNEG